MNPLLWVMAALMAAGTGAQYQGAKKVDKERTKALIEERMRREKRQRENEATAQQTLKLFDNQAGKEKAAAATREAATRQQVSTPTQDAAGRTLLDPQSGPTGVNINVAQRHAKEANDYLATRAKMKAALGAYGDVMGQTGAAATRFGQDIDANNQSIRSFQQSVLPMRLEYANQTGREWSTAGDIMKLAAAIMMPYALGAGAGAGASQAAIDAEVAAGLGQQMPQGAVMGSYYTPFGL